MKTNAAWIARIAGARPGVRTFLRGALLASLILHLAVGWPLRKAASGGLSPDQMKALEGEYGKKVAAAKRAGQVARDLAGKITMPPPPPDPEGVVSGTLNQALAGDIEKVVGKLLDLQVTRKLTDRVAASLKDELGEAARQIAAGKLTEEEIQALHERFKKKAHATAVEALKDYRVETQVERATMSTTEWYENNVSKTLFGNIEYELFRREYGRLRWRGMWSGEYTGWTRFLDWSHAKSLGYLKDKLARLERVADGASPKALLDGLSQLHQGSIQNNGTHPTPSWQACVYGGIDVHEKGTATWQAHMSEGILREYYPHREAEMKAVARRCDELWTKALDAAGAYAERPDARARCLAALRDLTGTVAALLKPADPSLAALNWAARVDVLTGPRLGEMYALFGEELTRGLEPLVRTFAKGQFKKGIIAHKDGVDAAMKEFGERIAPLLRRDVEAMIPRKVFARLVFDASSPFKTYRTPGIGESTHVPSEADAKAERELLARRPELRPYVEQRLRHHEENFRGSVASVTEEILNAVLTGGLLLRDMSRLVEGVDYADRVQEKLDAREAALRGRSQDLAKLTPDGVPDTSAPLVALLFGASKGHGANLQPVDTTLQPAYVTRARSAAALRLQMPKLPPHPAKWGFEEQAEARPAFKSPRIEAIPFLPRFPRLDGDLSDWGDVRPLVLKAPKGEEPVLVYAAWNYQGFFFGYRVRQAAEKYYFPTPWGQTFNHNTGDVGYVKTEGVDWAFRGDSFRICFDTLDARNQNRGEPHGQEFVVFPRGTDSDPQAPGVERVFESQRDARSKEYRGVKAGCKVFLQQPPPEQGPDGTGPYRVATFAEDGYTVEVFIPRSLFRVPVFAPGWFIGFECFVARGYQNPENGRSRLAGQPWASTSSRDAESFALNPGQWGDLLLLGTDPRVVAQEADERGTIAGGVVPGHSYLLSVIDPDRNVSPSAEDTVLVSAEARGGGNDVEVFVLKETGKNTGVFRGYINTQPGAGREVQGVLELMPGAEVGFAYVDFANAKGERGIITELKLPAVSGLMSARPSKENEP
jgi:hypothetical protein